MTEQQINRPVAYIFIPGIGRCCGHEKPIYTDDERRETEKYLRQLGFPVSVRLTEGASTHKETGATT